jgi:hypothetical protein
MASLLSPERPSDELLEPFRKQTPEPPQQADKNSEDKETVLELRSLQDYHQPGKGQVDEQDSEDDFREKLEDLPPNRNARLWSRELPAATLGTDLGTPRTHMKPWAEFDVVTSSTGTAEQRLSRRHPSALVAEFHGISRMSD